MKAALCRQYGPPEVLQIEEVDRPVCKDDEILVRIRAASVNSGDVKIRSLAVNGFMKIAMQLFLGFFKPRKPILGMIYAGVVEETGNNTSHFNPGDTVFGMTGFKFGAYAEYIAIKENSVVATMPVNASFEEAAALPFGWHTAIHFFEKAGVKAYQKPAILVYGSTGSVGIAAVQLAQYFDADLTTVCSTAGKDLMESLGVKKVIYYDFQDFAKSTKKFDFIFDAVGKITKSECKHLLTPNGRFATVGGWDMAVEKIAQLQLIKELFENGKCRAIIDKAYPFSEIVAANRYVDSGRKKGNVVVVME